MEGVFILGAIIFAGLAIVLVILLFLYRDTSVIRERTGELLRITKNVKEVVERTEKRFYP